MQTYGESGGLRNGLVLNNFHGFRMYTSSNLPAVGTGPGTTGSANQNTNFGVIVGGHDSAVATAEQINKTKHIVTLTALLTLFVVCTYTVGRFFVQKQSLLPNITQRKGRLNYGYF